MTRSRLATPGRMSIYLRLFLPFAVAVVVVSAFAWWTSTTLLTETLEQRVDDQLAHATGVLARGTFPLTPDLLRRVAELQDADFALLREDGTVGLSSIDSTRRDLIELIEQGRRGETSSLHEQYSLVFTELTAERNRDYVAIAGIASLHDIRAAGRRAGWWLGGLAFAATLLMAAVGHAISKNISSPIRDFSLMAKKIAAGDREVRADLSVPGELEELKLALNDMATRLGDYEQEMIRTNRLANLGEIAARVAHEIRNPLTAMKLHAQMLEERLGSQSDRHLAAQLLDEINRLDLVVASTLALGRPASLELETADINAAVREVVALITPQFEHRHIALDVDTDRIEPQLLDADKLKQVIFNLLTNAADELSEGGRVRITTTQTATGVRLDVEDSGPGLGERSGQQIFDGVDSDKPLGLGIGLVIAKELVEMHGGTIAADVGSMGGARFSIELPRRPTA